MAYKSETIQKIKEINLQAYRKLGELIGEENEDVFNDKISDEMLNISNADGITFWVKKDDSVEFRLLKNRSMKSSLGGVKNNITFPSLKLFDEFGRPDDSSVICHSINTAKTVCVGNVYDKTIF